MIVIGFAVVVWCYKRSTGLPFRVTITRRTSARRRCTCQIAFKALHSSYLRKKPPSLYRCSISHCSVSNTSFVLRGSMSYTFHQCFRVMLYEAISQRRQFGAVLRFTQHGVCGREVNRL